MSGSNTEDNSIFKSSFDMFAGTSQSDIDTCSPLPCTPLPATSLKKRKVDPVEETMHLKQMKDRKNEPDNKDDDYHFCMQVQGSLDSRKKAMAKLYIHQYLTQSKNWNWTTSLLITNHLFIHLKILKLIEGTPVNKILLSSLILVINDLYK